MLLIVVLLIGCEQNPRHEHNYIERVVEPTCTEKGYTEYKCECGDLYVRNEVTATFNK